MYQKIKKYVEISPREFRGMFVFLILLIIIYVSPFVYERIMFEPLKISIETLAPKIAEIESFDEKSDNFYDEKAPVIKGELFDFDPNNLAVKDWIRLGLSEKQATGIKKYEAKGGKFRTKEDVKKMYFINAVMYQRIEPYIKLPRVEENTYQPYSNNKTGKEFGSRSTVNIELNSADSSSLTTIRGVGPSFATRIIKYRNQLGGFVSTNQLREIYGVDSAKFEQIFPQVHVNSQIINKININRCTADQIKNFPYLRFKQSNAIIAYRNQHGNFKSASDLNKIAILTPELIQKITPYLNFND